MSSFQILLCTPFSFCTQLSIKKQSPSDIQKIHVCTGLQPKTVIYDLVAAWYADCIFISCKLKVLLSFTKWKNRFLVKKRKKLIRINWFILTKIFVKILDQKQHSVMVFCSYELTCFPKWHVNVIITTNYSYIMCNNYLYILDIIWIYCTSQYFSQ